MIIRHKKRISKRLIEWFKNNKRPLPWRNRSTWYDIWISEVMLQQTQVKQAIPYYHRFKKHFPNVSELAKASQEYVLKIWEGLGYYSRARNLHLAAQIIVNQYRGQIPQDKNELLKLPGFGPYTTNAVLSLAFNKPYAVVDGNVQRVIARLFLITDDIRQTQTLKKINYLVGELISLRSPAVFNEAVMELGATICTPDQPLCASCPINDYCLAFKKDYAQCLPFKSRLKAKPHIRAHTFIIDKCGKYLLAKRPQNGLLAGLWEFPTYGLNRNHDNMNITPHSSLKKIGISAKYVKSWGEIRHSYTHFHVYLIPHLFRYNGYTSRIEFYTRYKWLDFNLINEYPLHKVMLKTMEMIKNELKIIS